MGFFDRETELAAKGTYAARLEDCSLDETRENPRLSVRYKLHTGQTMWQNFTFKDTTKKWIGWQLDVIGATKKAKELSKGSTDYSVVARASLEAIGEHVGSYYDAEVTHREYNGKTYADLKLNHPVQESDVAQYKVASTTVTAPPPKEYDVDVNEGVPF